MKHHYQSRAIAPYHLVAKPHTTPNIAHVLDDLSQIEPQPLILLSR